MISLGILIFERIRNEIKLNFVYAIIQCSLDTFPILLDDVPSCSTFQEACRLIETNHALDELSSVLIAKIKTFFYCSSCNDTPDSLQSSSNQIFIFKLSSNNQLIAYPVLTDVDKTNDDEAHCTYCDYKTTNIEMQVYKQLFFKCPSCLIVSISIVPLLSPYKCCKLFRLHDLLTLLLNTDIKQISGKTQFSICISDPFTFISVIHLISCLLF